MWFVHAQVDWLWAFPALGMVSFALLGIANVAVTFITLAEAARAARPATSKAVTEPPAAVGGG